MAIGEYPTNSKNNLFIGVVVSFLCISYNFIRIKDIKFWMKPTLRDKILRICLCNFTLWLTMICEWFREVYETE